MIDRTRVIADNLGANIADKLAFLTITYNSVNLYGLQSSLKHKTAKFMRIFNSNFSDIPVIFYAIFCTNAYCLSCARYLYFFDDVLHNVKNFITEDRLKCPYWNLLVFVGHL